MQRRIDWRLSPLDERGMPLFSIPIQESLRMAKKKRTVLYSSAGKKLYAVRDEKGEFVDIQSYQRSHADDMRHKSKAELEASAKKKKTSKKAAKPKKKKAAKKAKTAKKKKKKSAKRS